MTCLTLLQPWLPPKLLIAGMTDANGQINDEEITKDLKVIEEAYRYNKAGDQLKIVPVEFTKTPDILFNQWLKLNSK